jgi:hypothetical protein
METPLIVPGDLAMVSDLAPRLRPADADELRANGREPLEGLRRAASLSAHLDAILAPDGRPIALYGFVDLGAYLACPWLLGSEDLVTKHRAWFIRQSPAIVSSGDYRWSSFWNRVDARNTVHVRWLRWVGFQVDTPVAHGPFHLPFHNITRNAPSCAT